MLLAGGGTLGVVVEVDPPTMAPIGVLAMAMAMATATATV
jgi:hypothetical protein